MEPVWDRPWGTHGRPELIKTNQLGSSWWGVNGSAQLAKIVSDGFAVFGVPDPALLRVVRPASFALSQFDAPSFYLHNKGVYYHASNDTPEVVPATGLRTAVQAFAKIFDDVNRLDLQHLAPRPVAPATASTR